ASSTSSQRRNLPSSLQTRPISSRVYREIKRNSLGAHAIEIRRGKSRKFGWENSLADDTRIPLLSGAGFTGCGKTQYSVILSEAKNLFLFLLLYLNRREILRFAQNDRTRPFFRSLFSLRDLVALPQFRPLHDFRRPIRKFRNQVEEGFQVRSLKVRLQVRFAFPGFVE